ncbi:MAG: 5-formyltetrahydrofolate cyclo-ligase [Alphaproteobacteria bacterium]
MDKDKLKQQKEDLRDHARRVRSLLVLNADDQASFCNLFFDKIEFSAGQVIASYWPIGREFDTHILMDECIERGARIALPVIDDGSRILRFALWTPQSDVEMGRFGICQPVLNEDTEFVDPDIVIMPLLAFDRQGNRLGYGGGYYDSTVLDLRTRKDIVAVGVGFSKQACLFSLPCEDHDVKMDWIITESSAQKFS